MSRILNILNPFTFMPMPDPTAWYKPDGLTNGLLNTWVDSSGNGYNLTNDGNQPNVIENTLNSLPIVDFAGSKYLFNDALGSLFSGEDIPLTIFTVFFKGTGLYIYSMGNSVGNGFIGFRHNWTFATRDDALAGNNWTYSTVTSGQYAIGRFNTNGINQKAELNKEGEQNSSVDLGQITLDKFSLGALFINGSFLQFSDQKQAEFIIYDRELTSDEISSVYNYLSGKYGI